MLSAMDGVEGVRAAPRRGGRAPSTSRSQVLDLVRTRAPISRVELAELTGLTQAAISHTVRALLAEGLLRETGDREWTGGKPRVMLTLDPLARCAVGVQLGADWLVVVITDVRGAVVARTRVRGARRHEPDAVVQTIARHVDVLLRASGVGRRSVVGLGLAVPGTLDLDAGAIAVSRSLDRWQGFPVRSRLGAAVGLPVVMDNDATAAAVGEYWAGRTVGSAAHCTLYMGAGIGAGIVVGGAVYRGASGNPGPLGQMHLHREGHAPGPTLEELAAPHAVARRARRAVAEGRRTTARLSADADPITDFGAVATAAVQGDALAVELVEDSAEYLADAAVTVANLLDVDSVVLAGPAFSTAGSLYAAVVERRLRAELHAAARHGVRVALAAHVADAAAVGAAALVLQEELAPRRR
ncbi:ROK family transcriptional regulator [Cellulomonas endometrii]|uniref:ROK family transcriptional regulator n=1 Tax=Cellulomonas endometrii TaxID=3036301 RepID=UPI0024AE4C05|nr:ROK family transcriptional regulator [Cellulomonas endometrii]